MAGVSTSNNEHLIRSNLWSAEMKDILLADLFAQKWVRMLDFPDGDTLNMPTLGQFEVSNYVEGQPVKYTAMDTGNFTFTINEYLQTGTYITEKMKQDSFYMSQLVAAFIPKQMRSLSERMESDVLKIGPSGQTAADLNSINGAAHRWVAGGANGVITVQDFAKANYALDMANVPRTNRVMIVHPSVEFTMNTLTNLVNVSNNPTWEGIVASGFRTGLRFTKSIYGIDVYVSQFLPKITAGETIGGVSVNTSGVANVCFSAAADVLPFVGSIRQAPKVDSEYNKDYQREEYVVTCRYGYKLFRPENLVTILTATDQVG